MDCELKPRIPVKTLRRTFSERLVCRIALVQCRKGGGDSEVLISGEAEYCGTENC